MSLESLNDRLCVLTGATGGIGQALAQTLSENGVRLILSGRNTAALTALAVDNLHEVAVDWVFGSSEAPLVVVIVIAAVGGMIIGALLRKRRT